MSTKRFVLQVHLVFHGNILTIRICLHLLFIDFMCIFMHE